MNKLYHFTDRSCLSSIRETGLQSWVSLEAKGVIGRKGSSALSRSLDKEKGLGDFVRLSFTPQHPMMFVALRERRLLDVVVLEIDLNVILSSGTLFSDRNAAASTAIISSSPSIVRFDIIHHSNQFEVPIVDRAFFQAEVLIRTT